MHFLRELKEEGIIVCDWVSGEENSADLFTKNLAGQVFDKHASVFVGRDKYMKLQWGQLKKNRPSQMQRNQHGN
jgi:hypothetical protein